MKHAALLAGILPVLIIFTGCTTVDDPPVQAVAPAPVSSSPAESPTGSSFKETAEADKENKSSITPYPFDTCAVQFHKPFKDGKPAYRRVYQNQEVLFCCTPCVKAFDMNPDPYMPRIVAAANAR